MFDLVSPLRQVPIATVGGTLTMGTHHRIDATAGNLAVTLPSLASWDDNNYLAVEKTDVSTNTITVTTAGSEGFEDTSTSLVIKTPAIYYLKVTTLTGFHVWKVDTIVLNQQSPKFAIDTDGVPYLIV